MRQGLGFITGVATVSMVCLFLITGCATGEDQVNTPSPSVHATGRLAKLQACLATAGWETVPDGGTLKGPSLSQEQSPLYEADQTQCIEETGFLVPFTAEEYHRLYPLEVANHKCLLDHGFESADPPSEQQFVEDWLAASEVRMPYQANTLVFHDSDDEVFEAATQVCPPPLWGF